MDAVALLRWGVEEVHRGLLRELEPLEDHHLVYQPQAGANHIGFIAWHVLWTLDSAVHQVIYHEPRPLLWESEDWHQRFGLAANDRGTGFTPERVRAFAPSKELLVAYGRRIGEAFAPAFATLNDADLDRPDPRRPDFPSGRRLLSWTIGHCYSHLGEVRYLKGLQGMPGPL